MTTTPQQIDAFAELMNIGVGRAAGSLNQICDSPVRLCLPEVKLLLDAGIDSFLEEEGGPAGGKIAAVRMRFSGAFGGFADLIFPAESAAHLVSLLIGDADSTELDALRASTLTEVGNIVLNGVLGTMTNLLGDHVVYDLPTYLEATSAQLKHSYISQDATLLLAQTQFFVGQSEIHNQEEELAGKINLLFGVDSFRALTDRMEALLDPTPR